MPERVKSETIMHALGVVVEAERDRKLAKRLTRLARKCSIHFALCEQCRAARGRVAFPIIPGQSELCVDGARYVLELGKAAAR